MEDLYESVVNGKTGKPSPSPKKRAPQIKEKHSGSENELSDMEYEANGLDFPAGSEDESQGQEEEASDIVTVNGVVPMQSYMRIVNKLQSVCRNLEQDGIFIPTPRIAVVGGQSTGKSSLLEQIAGDVFLPRGAGTVTKSPVILQFINSEKRRYKVDGTEYMDAKGVERAIRQKSEFAARRDGGISNDPITVEINLPTAPNMTLVDLPGLIEVSAENQSQDLPLRIEEMVLEQISNDQTIILAVASADSDFQNSKSIKLAQMVDPHGNRTIAVVTKMDKVDFTDDEDKGKLRQTLAGTNVPVKLGVVGVVNRTKKFSFEETKRREAQLLKMHLPEIASKHGIDYLCNNLSKLQMHHIEGSLHNTTREIEMNMKEQMGILDKLGIGEVVDKRDKLKKLAMKFGSDYKAELEGGNRNVNIDSLCGSVKIKQILGYELADALEALDPLSQATNERIINAIFNHRGTEGFNHLAEMAYESVAPYQVEMLEQDCLKSLDSVYLVMRDDIPKNCFSSRRSDSCGSQASQYPKLQSELHEVIRKLLAGPNEDVKEKIKDYIRTQAYTSITYDPNFQKLLNSNGTQMISLISPKNLSQLYQKEFEKKEADSNSGGADSGVSDSGEDPEYPDTAAPHLLHNAQQYGQQHQPLNRIKSMTNLSNLKSDEENNTGSSKTDAFEESVIELVKKLVKTYFNIVKAQVQDQVPKIIKKHLIYHASENLSNTMMDFCNASIASRSEASLIREPDEIIVRRKGTQDKIKKLEDALIGFKEIKMMLEYGIENPA